jgi:hypothetical protein
VKASRDSWSSDIFGILGLFEFWESWSPQIYQVPEFWESWHFLSSRIVGVLAVMKSQGCRDLGTLGVPGVFDFWNCCSPRSC